MGKRTILEYSWSSRVFFLGKPRIELDDWDAWVERSAIKSSILLNPRTPRSPAATTGDDFIRETPSLAARLIVPYVLDLMYSFMKC